MKVGKDQFCIPSEKLKCCFSQDTHTFIPDIYLEIPEQVLSCVLLEQNLKVLNRDSRVTFPNSLKKPV